MTFEWLILLPLACAVPLFLIGQRQRLLVSLLGLAVLLACARGVLDLPLHLTTRLWGQQWMLDELGQAMLLYAYAATAVLILIALAADQAGWFVAPALAHCGLLGAAVLLRSVPLSFLLYGSALLLCPLTVRPGSPAAAHGAARWLVATALPIMCVPLAVTLLQRDVTLPGQLRAADLGAWLAWLALWAWWTLSPWDGTTRLWHKDRLEVGALFLWAVKDWTVLYLWLQLWQQYPTLRSETTMAALGIAGLATVVFSGVLGFVQTRPAGVLACAAMSALGIAVQGLTASAGAAIEGGLVVLASRSLAVLLAGTALVALPRAAGRDAATNDQAPRWRKPLALGAFALGVLALAGLPPLGSFTGREQIQPWLTAEQPYLRLAWLSASLGIVLGLVRSAWPLWHTEAESNADPRADLPLLLVAALLLAVLWAGLQAQGMAEWLEQLFRGVLPALQVG
jgi:formate hydrogenlyase subunit 3/multisubunit Na+/H+ antiporter MnhD subunit